MPRGCRLAFWATGSPARLSPASVAFTGGAAGTCAASLRRAAGTCEAILRRAAGTCAAILRNAGHMRQAVGPAGHGPAPLGTVLDRDHIDPGIFRRMQAREPAGK